MYDIVVGFSASTMIIIDGYEGVAWDPNLRPVGYGGFGQEPFEPWWSRHHQQLAHLHPQIAEQWIHKHWTHSPYSNLPLEQLRWTLETWPTDHIVRSVHLRLQFGALNPEWDYEVFHGKDFEPGLTMDATGTWNIPIILLATPDGVRNVDDIHPDVRLCLVEGHQRFRYLNALYARGQCAKEQELFLLTLDAA